ncbi:Alpha-parvin [Chelonia mydas]|uniref:Alpha-parvin n=1 Tax=Chelonia mydas TaxID=8469 RepID=M7BI32_CHEMY|nr:Alpha-parvin [Chelonia mydas]
MVLLDLFRQGRGQDAVSDAVEAQSVLRRLWPPSDPHPSQNQEVCDMAHDLFQGYTCRVSYCQYQQVEQEQGLILPSLHALIDFCGITCTRPTPNPDALKSVKRILLTSVGLDQVYDEIILLQVQRLVYLLWKKVWKIDHRLSELQEEGINAINLPLSPIPFELDPEDTMLEENEVRTMIDPNSRSDPKLQELIKVLIDWINDVLVGERIIVKDLAEDMYDGQVLQKLFEKLESEKLNVAEVTQSEIAQKQKLQTVLEKINETLKLPPRSIKWTVDSVHAKSLVAILRLLVALSQYFRAPIRLPDHVSIQVVVVQKREGILQSRQIQEEITGNTDWIAVACYFNRFDYFSERDAFDTLFDHAPDKLNVVKKTLITFVNKHLNKLNLEVTELETQVINVSFSFELMQDGGLEKPKPRPEDIVNCDLKSTLRVLYNLFTKYRNVE